MDQRRAARVLYLSQVDNHLDYFQIQQSFPYTQRALAQKRQLSRLFKKSHMVPGLSPLSLQLLAYFLNTYQPGKEKVELHLIQAALFLLNDSQSFQRNSVLYPLFVSLLESNKHNYALHFQLLLHFLLHLHLAQKTQVLQQVLESQLYRFENINNPCFQLLCARLLTFGKRFNKEYFQKDYPRDNPFFILQYSEYLIKKKQYQEAFELLLTPSPADHSYLLHLQLFKVATHRAVMLSPEQRVIIFQACIYQNDLFYPFMIYCLGLDYSTLQQEQKQSFQDQLLKFALLFLEINSCSNEVLALILKLFSQYQQNHPDHYSLLITPFKQNILYHQYHQLKGHDIKHYLMTNDQSIMQMKIELLNLTYPGQADDYYQMAQSLQ